MTKITRFALSHKRLVVGFWVVLTLIGMASAGAATKAMKQKFSVPGKEGWVTNEQIMREFNGTGGNGAPLLAVVTLPPGRSLSSGTVQHGLSGVEATLQRRCRDRAWRAMRRRTTRAFVSKDGRTTFVVAYPPPDKTSPSATTRKPPRKRRRRSPARAWPGRRCT